MYPFFFILLELLGIASVGILGLTLAIIGALNFPILTKDSTQCIH